MKVLVFNGSPKRKGSDTMHMTRAFLDGMESENKFDIRIIDVIGKNIEFCRGCFVCKRNGGTCVIKDDMREILDEILQSDIIIWSFPLYCYGMPAHLKALVDRTMPLSSMAMAKVGEHYEHISEHDFSKTRYIMICGCGFPSGKNNFEAMTAQFKLMFGEERSTVITVPESPMFNVKEAEPVTKPFLEIMKEAGHEYAVNGEISADTWGRINTPMIPEEIYTQLANSVNA
ncbi:MULTISPECIES: flavodoxin family protein [unclassified Ruminococcus]|uniref:flavodoxin family protein n=1 Tax=unclassified Ruminococcus TaxID=2608920 RepID=UPI002108812C|nr:MULTISPECIES: flavodoxin family protein [unclassified Ruminococcus]MCQ4022071.1 hypothetical protein [Ruminococcus sp. zg-924]MCQ4114391.1 hypothetical protein [Ruminococcus sp. zg-921]